MTYACSSSQSSRAKIELPVPQGWSHRLIHFEGRQWHVRESTKRVAAGPSFWSSSSQSVFLDANAHLHLRLRRQGEHWLASEIATSVPDGPLELQVDIAGNLSNLDPSIVAGIFLYQSDSSEMDVEFGRWGEITAPNAQFVVAPPGEGRIHRFMLPKEHTRVSIRIAWLSDSIHFSTATERGTVAQWSYSRPDLPERHNHRLHINLWTLFGRNPSEIDHAEIVVQRVKIKKFDRCRRTPKHD